MQGTSFALVIVLLPLLAVAQNSDLPFNSNSTGADGPLVLPTAADISFGYSMVYDEARKEIVRFGGNVSTGTANADTWVMRSTGWTKLSPTNSPPATVFGAMVYDVARAETVLLTNNSQTWVWDGVNWTQKSPATSPPARMYGAMAWHESNQEAVLFGGQTPAPVTVLQDTWVWDGITWTQRLPANKPSARVCHAMAPYPPLSAVMLACGNAGVFSTGAYHTTVKSDAWLWTGTDWTQVNPAWLPAVQGPSLVYDPLRMELLFFGGYQANSLNTNQSIPNSSLISWNHARSPTASTRSTSLPGRWFHGAVWDGNKNRMVVGAGLAGGSSAGSRQSDTWYWMGAAWNGATGPDYVLDLDSKPDSIWNFTSILIPTGTTVRFARTNANTPVVWLASENVSIVGTIDVSGLNATTSGQDGLPAPGGPGGFDGGEGSSATLTAQAGAGPAGGVAGAIGATAGGNAGPTGGYVTPFGLPLIGGSGGGGAHVAGGNGSKGGGGGGGILIASSKDITVTGTIKATGGTGNATAPAGGHGGGGTIKLMADRVLATGGTLNVAGGAGAANQGILRVEAFVRQLTPANITGSLFQSVPTDVPPLQQAGGRLFIKTVDGQTIAAHPTANVINPDVIFSNPDPIQIVVEALNIPNGTPVTMQIKHSNGTTYNLPETGTVTLANGLATFTTTVPAGSGTVQAFATYTVGQDPPVP